jgi:hypothetical protein
MTQKDQFDWLYLNTIFQAPITMSIVSTFGNKGESKTFLNNGTKMVIDMGSMEALFSPLILEKYLSLSSLKALIERDDISRRKVLLLVPSPIILSLNRKLLKS